MSNSDPSNKVLAAHLERCAYVYVRQSSYYQVEHNLESQRRQYNMRTWALELGWPEERIVVVDEDQGSQGANARPLVFLVGEGLHLGADGIGTDKITG